MSICFTVNTQAAEHGLHHQELRTPQGLKVLFHKNSAATSVSLGIGFKYPQAYPTVYAYVISNYLGTLTLTILRDIWHQSTLEQVSVSAQQPSESNWYIHSGNGKQLRVLLSSSPKQFEGALSQLLHSLQQVVHSPDRLQNALSYIKSREIEISNQREYFARMVLRYLLITGKLQSNPNLILEAFLKGIQPADIKRYASLLFTQENLVISASGNIDPDLLLQLIDRYFGKLPANAPHQKSRTFHPPKILAHKKTFHLLKDMPGHLTFIRQHRQFRNPLDGIILKDLGFVLVYPLFIRLKQTIEEQGLAWLVDGQYSFTLSSMEFPIPMFQIIVNTSQAATDDVIAHLMSASRRIKKQGITLAQLKAAKEYYLNVPDKKYFDESLEPFTQSTLASLPESAADYLLNKQLSIPTSLKLFGLERVTELIEAPQKLKAFNKALKTYFDPDQFIILKVGPK